MASPQHDPLIDAFHDEEREIERLCRAVHDLDAEGRAAAAQAADTPIRRQMQYASAQLTRHRIALALLASRIGARRV